MIRVYNSHPTEYLVIRLYL